MYSPSTKLTATLQKYLRFDPEQLSIGLWSGNLRLHDVELREEVFDHPDYTMVSATIGSLNASIPWRTLMISTATVELGDVTIVLAPKSPDLAGEVRVCAIG